MYRIFKKLCNSNDTFTAYRREIERMLHWSWLICKKPLKEITRNEIRDYLQFVNSPPKSWIATKIVDRFITDSDGNANPILHGGLLLLKSVKSHRRHGKLPDKVGTIN